MRTEALCACRRMFDSQNRKMDIAKEVVRKRPHAAKEEGVAGGAGGGTGGGGE